MAVDDNPLDLDILSMCHARARMPAHLLCFTKADELLSYVERASAGEEHFPSYVLVDVRMPDIDGFELVERLQSAAPDLDNVALFTTSEHPNDSERAERLGVELVLKPVGLERYMDFLQRLSQRIDS